MTDTVKRRAVLLGTIGAGSAACVASAQPAGVRAWNPPCTQPGDVASILLEGSGAPAGTVVIFGLVFAPGQVPNGSGVAARIAGGGPVPTQLDVVTRHADGSARFGVAAVAAPALRAGERAAVLFARGQRPAAPLDALAALETRQAVLELGPRGGRRWRSDLLALTRQAFAAGQGIWQAGPLAVQARVRQAVPADAAGGVTSLRLVADITVQADGVLRVDAWLRNDIAMRRGGGRARYDMQLLLDGRVALHAEGLTHHHYAGWGRSVAVRRDGRPAPEPPLPRHDTQRLADLGAIARYDLSTGVADRLFEDMAADVAGPAWAQPLGPRGIAQDMFPGGARPDIGPATRSQAIWLITGDRRAAAHAIGQAEAAGSIPWHFWDGGGEDGGWLDTRNWPQLWTDPRGGYPPRGLLSQVPTDTGWRPDCAHQPDLSYVPYLLTGRRAFLDELQAQAAWCVMSQAVYQRGAPGRRAPGETVNVVRGNQVRGGAWSLRQLGDSAWATPGGDSHHAWVVAAEQGNWAWVRAQLPGWTARQGNAHGYIPPESTTPGELKPWMQDMFASAAAAAARRGQPDARAVLAWMENFLAGRFLAAEQGFNPRDGCAYVLAHAPQREGAPLYDSWARIGAETVARGWSNGDGWGGSVGNTGQYAMQSLAALIDILESEPARRAYAWLEGIAPPFTRAADFSRDPIMNIVPRDLPRVPTAALTCARTPR